MKILMTIDVYENLTGSELHVYEVARQMVKQGHKVTIAPIRTNNCSDLYKRSVKQGIEIISVLELRNHKFDIMNSNQLASGEIASQFVKLCPIVHTCHSLNKADRPIPFASYVMCDRDDIFQYIQTQYDQYVNRSCVVNHAIDTTRFNMKDVKPGKGRILFVGTVELQRKPTIEMLIKSAQKDMKVIIVGKQILSYLDELPKENYEWYEATWDVEQYTKNCEVTAGIFDGRSTAEGWLCGKPGMVFQVQPNGYIDSYKLIQPPADLGIYDSRAVSKKMVGIYKEVIDAV